MLLAGEALRERGLKGWQGILATMPVYWLLLWPAAVTALFELVVAPSRWTKTRHGLAERDLPLAERPTGRLSLDPRAGVAQG